MPLCFAVLGVLICAAYAPGEIADLDSSPFVAELTYNDGGADLAGWDTRPTARHEVVVGSARVSFLVQPSDDPPEDPGPPEARENDSFWQHMASELDDRLQLVPVCAPELADGETIPESFGDVTAQSRPEPATVLLLASSAVVFSRRWLKR